MNLETANGEKVGAVAVSPILASPHYCLWVKLIEIFTCISHESTASVSVILKTVLPLVYSLMAVTN